jgi:uncharacterized UBP type Zn finger protein
MSKAVASLRQRLFKFAVRRSHKPVRETCTHRDQIQPVALPEKYVCQECVALGDRWIYLRICLICGHVGCCDNSKNKHATQHFHTTGHPVIRSLEPNEDWMWCFIDQVFL